MPNLPSRPSAAQNLLRLIHRGETITYGGVALLLLFLAGAIAAYLIKFLITSVN